MDMTGESRIEAPRERVWQALNDPEVLKASIAGCEELEKTSDTEFTAKVRAKVGPVSARFAGKVTLSDLDPPNGYRIQGEGSGGAAGFAKGGATVTLEPDGDSTVLRYEVQATVGGKLAQIGSRLIDGTARKMADDFFARFKAQVEGNGKPEQASETTGPETEPRVPLAGATVDEPASPPDLPTAPETDRAFAADSAPDAAKPRSGPEMAQASTPPRTVVQPELDATPGASPDGEAPGQPPPAAGREVPRDMRPTSDIEPPPGEGTYAAPHPDSAAAGGRSPGPGGYRAGMARLVGGNPIVWGIGILAVILILVLAFG